MDYTDVQLVDRHLALRQHLEQLAKEADETAKPFLESKLAIENEMLRRLNERQAQNSATPSGTFFKERITTTKMVDKNAFFDHIFTLKLRGVPNCYDMLTQAVSKDSVVAYIGANGGHPPPGIETDQFIKVKVRKN